MATVGALWWLDVAFDWTSWLGAERISGLLDASGIWAPVLFVGLMASAVVFAPIPSFPLDVAAGAYFGWFEGGLLAVAGATLGAGLSFAIARYVGRDLVERWVGGHMNLCRDCSNHVLVWFVLASRLIPAVSFDAVSYGAGLTGMSLVPFLLATAVGMLPLTFLFTAAGPVLLVDSSWLWLLGGLAVLMLVVLPAVLERAGLIDPEKWFHRSDPD